MKWMEEKYTGFLSPELAHITRQQETIFQCTDEPRLASGYTEGVRVFRTCLLAEGCSLEWAVSVFGGS